MMAAKVFDPKANLIYGWYESWERPLDPPEYDPPHDAPCLYCGVAVRDDDVKEVEVDWDLRLDGRPYFYRVHLTCHVGAHDKARDDINRFVRCMIERGEVAE